MNFGDFYTVEQAAKKLECSTYTIKEWKEKGKINVQYVNHKTYMIPKEEVMKIENLLNKGFSLRVVGRMLENNQQKENDIEKTNQTTQQQNISLQQNISFPDTVEETQTQKPPRLPYEEWKKKHDDYLQTPRWKILSNARKIIDAKKCQICGSRENIAVHHMQYDKEFGQESLDDLVTLCQKCHDAVRAYKNKQRKEYMNNGNETL